MKKFFLISSMLLLAFLANGQSGTKVKAGDAAPQFTLKMLDGSLVSKSSLEGKTVVLNFWTSWCPSCRTELARVQEEIVDKFDDDDFLFIAVNVGESRNEVQKFRELTGYKFPMALDEKGDMFTKFGDGPIPANFVIGSDGKIAHASVGYDKFQQLISDIDKTLKK